MADIKKEKQEVIIRRIYNNERLPENIRENSKMRFGVFSRNSRMIMPVPLSDKHAERLYAEVCNVSPGQGFYETINDYLLSLYIDVPHDGLRLNITTDKDGYPEEPIEYLYWKIAESHINYKTGIVHENYQSARSHPFGMFYVEDINRKKKEQIQSIDDRTEAMIELSKLLAEDKDKVDWVLSYFGRNPYVMSDADKKIALSEIIDGNNHVKPVIKVKGVGEISYEQRPAKVFEYICKDTALENKAMIEMLERGGIITSSGGKYFFNEVELGIGIDDVINRITSSSAESKKLYVQLRARYDELKRESKTNK